MAVGICEFATDSKVNFALFFVFFGIFPDPHFTSKLSFCKISQYPDIAHAWYCHGIIDEHYLTICTTLPPTQVDASDSGRFRPVQPRTS